MARLEQGEQIAVAVTTADGEGLIVTLPREVLVRETLDLDDVEDELADAVWHVQHPRWAKEGAL